MRYVFVDAMGNLIQPDSVTTGFPQLLKENGLRRIRFHDLCHSCASLLLKEGVPMKQIQEWLGHSDISTTANIYAHLDSQSKNLSARTMANTLTLPEAQPIKKWEFEQRRHLRNRVPPFFALNLYPSCGKNLV